MKPLYLLPLIFVSILACGQPSSNKQIGKNKIVELKSLNKKPQPVDFISISEGDFKKLTANITSKAELDTTSSFDYNQGVLISESPFERNSYIIHPPKSPFDKRGRVAAAIINERLVFVGICPDDNPDCPSFPEKGPDLPDTCDPMPCLPDFGIDVGGTFPITRPACNAIILPGTLNGACALRQPCEQEGNTCKPRYRYFRQSFITVSGVLVKPVNFFFFTCKCSCS